MRDDLDGLEPSARREPVPDVHCDGPGAILVGVDGSESSMRAAAYAVGLARRQRCPLVAVYVRTPPSISIGVPAADSAFAESVSSSHDAVELQLRELIDRRPYPQLDAHLVVRVGDPYAELINVARKIRADAVVVGRSTKILHRLGGSMAVRLVRGAHWPVTVVP